MSTQSSCQNLIAICSLTHSPCTHCHPDGSCDKANCTSRSVPTWNDLIDIFIKATSPSKRREKEIVSCVRSLVASIGARMEDEVDLSADVLDKAHTRMSASGLSPYTIKSRFATVSALTNNRKRDIKLEYRKRGMVCPEADVPSVRTELQVNSELTEDQRLAISDEMARLRHSEKDSDRRFFVWLWFAYYFGVRPIDIGRLKWSCIVRHPSGKMWLDYIPGKTARKCAGRHAGHEIPRNIFSAIKPFIGDPEDYVIPRLTNRCGRKLKTHGEYEGFHAYLRRRTVNFMKSIGVTDRKPQYKLRKDRSAQTISSEGLVAEAQMLGHTPKVALDSYVNLSNLELRKP